MAPSFKEAHIVKGLAAGALAGLAASWAMNLAARLYARTTFRSSATGRERRLQLHERELLCIERSDPTGEGAERLAERFQHRRLSDRELNVARDLIHYAFGTLAGAAYGAIAELRPAITKSFGLLFAAALLVGGEEIATPLLGLLPPPQKLAWESHAAMAASHVVYGFALESARRASLHLFDRLAA